MRKLEGGILFWHVPSEKGTCSWCTWFEHEHVKEGTRDAGGKTDWDFKVGGLSYNTLGKFTKT